MVARMRLREYRDVLNALCVGSPCRDIIESWVPVRRRVTRPKLLISGYIASECLEASTNFRRPMLM